MITLKQYITEKRKVTTKLVKESVTTQPIKESLNNISINEDVSKLENIIKKLSIVHLIINKNLINESATEASINEEINNEFGEETYFKSEEEIDNFYVETMEEVASYLMEEGFFSRENKEGKEKLSKQFDELNSKLVGTKFDQTKNKDKWMERAKQEDGFNGSFVIDRGVLQYHSKSKNPLQGATGGSSSYGTAN